MMDRYSNGGICSDQTWTDGGMIMNGMTEIKGRDMDTREMEEWKTVGRERCKEQKKR